MTRFKKELIKRNITLEETLLYLPIEIGGATLEGTRVDSENLTITYYYTSIDFTVNVDRNLNLIG